MMEAIEGDIVYVSKPLYPGLLAGIWHKKQNGNRLLVDIDDYEAGGFARLSLLHQMLSLLRFDRADAYPLLIQGTFQLIGHADAITVSSTYLQKRFGGIIVPHGRDTDWLNPANYEQADCKKSLGLDSHQVVMFLGTPRPHKGLEELILAIKQLNRPNLCLALVGFAEDSPYVQKLKYAANGAARFFPPQPFAALPEFLAAADLLVIPQQTDSFSQGQVPAKVFDAMAMAKPIVATAVSDLPQILADETGLIVKPDSVEALAQGIGYLLDHPDEAIKMGQRARDRCTRYYSWSVMAQLLESLLYQGA
jgi:glycosyltransferase involved in cell wall biosynthesis